MQSVSLDRLDGVTKEVQNFGLRALVSHIEDYHLKEQGLMNCPSRLGYAFDYQPGSKAMLNTITRTKPC